MNTPRKETYWYRFWSVVNKTASCWMWIGGLDWHGYGYFTAYQRRRQAHIISYEIYKGGIPMGLELDHLCRNPGCINPAHLEAVTHKTNILRGQTIMAENAKKTHCKRGHELAGNNLHINKKGERKCKACDAMRSRNYRITQHEN